VEFLEHTLPDQAACGRNRETKHLKEDKYIPFINLTISWNLLSFLPTNDLFPKPADQDLLESK